MRQEIKNDSLRLEETKSSLSQLLKMSKIEESDKWNQNSRPGNSAMKRQKKENVLGDGQMTMADPKSAKRGSNSHLATHNVNGKLMTTID